MSGCFQQIAMRVENELGRRALIEAFITLDGIVERYDLGVDDVGNGRRSCRMACMS